MIKHLKTDDREYLLEIFPKNSIGCEIGVLHGDFASKIIEKINPKKLYLIDPWQIAHDDEYKNSFFGCNKSSQEEFNIMCRNVYNKFKYNIISKQIKICKDKSSNILPLINNDELDWIYIDGAHGYNEVKNDLILCFNKIKSGGYITGDDYLNNKWSGVKLAVDEFIVENLNKIEILFNDKLDNQFILRKL